MKKIYFSLSFLFTQLASAEYKADLSKSEALAVVKQRFINCYEKKEVESCLRLGSKMLDTYNAMKNKSKDKKKLQEMEDDAFKHYNQACKYKNPIGCMYAGTILLSKNDLYSALEKLNFACNKGEGEACITAAQTHFLLAKSYSKKACKKYKIAEGCNFPKNIQFK
jgi:TPR repeat protein